jgi:hypothetical protein
MKSLPTTLAITFAVLLASCRDGGRFHHASHVKAISKPRERLRVGKPAEAVEMPGPLHENEFRARDTIS